MKNQIQRLGILLLLGNLWNVPVADAALAEADIAMCYSPDAVQRQGGEPNMQVNLANAIVGGNVIHDNSRDGVRWHIAGFYMSTNNPVGQDNATVLGLVAGDASFQDVRDFGASVGADLVSYYAQTTGAAGNAYQPGMYSTIGQTWIWYIVCAHELGHNYGCAHADGLGFNAPGGSYRTVMLHNYCSGASIPYYSNPDIAYLGVPMLGSVAGNCGTGSLISGGNNSARMATAAVGVANRTPRVTVPANFTNVLYRWIFTNAPAVAPAGTTVTDIVSGASAIVRGVNATFTGSALRLPGGTTGNTAANSLAAYLDLPNGIISAQTNLTLEIWATPLSSQSSQRLYAFGRTAQAGNGAAGEWTGVPGSAAPGATTPQDELSLSLDVNVSNLGQQRLVARANALSTNSVDAGLPTLPGAPQFYTIVFQDGVGTNGASGGRVTWYRNGDVVTYLDVNFHLQNLADVNNWLGRSLTSADAQANVDCAEVRISNVALTPAQVRANYLLGVTTVVHPIMTPLNLVNCGGAGAGAFSPDQNYDTGGFANSGYLTPIDVSAVTNPAPQIAYQDQRTGDCIYTITGLNPSANYVVRLHFAELTLTNSGLRTFNVLLNGAQVLTGFDVFATAGATNKAVIRTFNVAADGGGQITARFKSVVNSAIINAIELLQGGLFTPVNLTATATNGQAMLAWTGSPDAAGYNIKRATSSGGPYTTIGSTVTTNFTDNSPVNAAVFYYVVSAVSGTNESFNSAEVSVTPAFTPNFSFETPGVGTYQYNPSGGGWTFTASSGINGSGLAANGSAFTSANPNAPDGVQVAFLQSIATISQPVSGFVPGVSYTVTFAAAQRATYNNGGQTWTLKMNTTTLGSYSPAATATNFVDYSGTFVAAASTYTMTFTGTDTRGGDNTIFLDNVRIRAVTPAVPSGLTATPGNAQVLLAWTASSGAASYNIKRATNSGGPYTVISPSAASTFADSSVAVGVTYYYVISAVGSSESGNSAEASATPVLPPTAPTTLTAVAGNGQVALNWTTPPGALGYNLKRATNSGGPYTIIATPTQGSYTDNQVLNGRNYFYVVSALNVGSESGNSSEASALPVFTPNFSFETPAITTYQYNPSGGSWAFSASSGINGSGLAANGSAFSSANPNAPQGTQAAFVQGTGAISQSLSGFVPGLQYNVTFAGAQRGSFNNGGQTWSVRMDNSTIGNFSPAAGATTYVDYTASFTASAPTHTLKFIGTDTRGGDNTVLLDNVRIVPVAPATPAGLAATPGVNQITLNWTASLGAANYNLKRATASNGTYTVVANLTATNFTDLAVTNGTIYYYKISAANDGGESADSAAVSGIILPSLTPPQVGWQMVNGQIRFDWPTNYFGWHLEAQTNGLGGIWSRMAGSEATNIFYVPLDFQNGSVFFRLGYP